MNDAIVFEFENDDGRAVLLQPQIVDSLAVSLIQIIGTLITAFDGEQHAPEILLAAADRGSLRLAYKAVITEIDGRTGIRIGVVANAAALLAAIYGGLWYTGTHLGFLKPTIEPQSKEQVFSSETRKLLAANTALRDQIDAMVKTAVDSRVDRVLLRLPGEATCELRSEGSGSGQFLGSRAEPIASRQVQSSRLTLTSRKIKVKYNGHEMDLPVGLSFIPGPSSEVDVRVLVVWESGYDPSPASQEMEISGSFISLSEVNLEVLQSIEMDDRSINGILVVKTRRVDG